MGRGQACLWTFNSSESMLPKSRGRMVKHAHSFSRPGPAVQPQLILIGGKVQRGEEDIAVKGFSKDCGCCVVIYSDYLYMHLNVAVQSGLVMLKSLLICKLKLNVTHARWRLQIQNDVSFFRAMCAPSDFTVKYLLVLFCLFGQMRTTPSKLSLQILNDLKDFLYTCMDMLIRVRACITPNLLKASRVNPRTSGSGQSEKC